MEVVEDEVAQIADLPADFPVLTMPEKVFSGNLPEGEEKDGETFPHIPSANLFLSLSSAE